MNTMAPVTYFHSGTTPFEFEGKIYWMERGTLDASKYDYRNNVMAYTFRTTDGQVWEVPARTQYIKR